MRIEPKHTVDWTSGHFPNWSAWLKDLVGVDGATGLEVGTFQGLSAVWFLENILTGCRTRLHCVDNWAGKGGGRELWESNLAPYRDRVSLQECSSELMRFDPRTLFDFVYVDGNHDARFALGDAVRAWPHLKPGGILIWDDYKWTNTPVDYWPKEGIDAFLRLWSTQFDLIHIGEQVCIRKK